MKWLLLLFLILINAHCSYAIGSYINNGDTIDDQGTGLTWQQDTADINNDGMITFDTYPDGDTAAWEDALAYCENLVFAGETDWRLPNIRELRSIVDYSRYQPAIDPTFQCKSDTYCSSTTGHSNQSSTSLRAGLDFEFGGRTISPGYVRCVRGGVEGPKLQIDITSDTDIVYSGTENFGFKVKIDNTGESDLIGIPITVEHATVYAYPAWTCLEDEKSENAVCSRNTPSATETTFSADIPAGGHITITGIGDIAAIPVSITVTAPGAVKTVIRGSEPPADLPGTQTVKLCSENKCVSTANDNLELDLSKDTIVLTHGLQPAGCEREKLWTAFKATSDNPAPAGYLLNQKYNGDVNVLQFFWKGACHGFGGLTKVGYEGARRSVYHAGEQLAYLLLQNLSVMYSRKVHFIGHSLGTAVTAYASNIFLRQTPYITDAQVTILDYPSAERVGKILDGNDRYGTDNDDWGKEQGFDRNFFASTLRSDINRPGFFLLVDNYFSSNKKIIDNVRSFGVGMTINGPSFYNYPELEDPGRIKVFLPDEEGVANDHSGVHQWYRWTMEPKEGENFTGSAVCSSVEWNNLPLILTHIWNPTPPAHIPVPYKIVDECCLLCSCNELGKIQQSLSPCSGGWHHSIIGGATCPIGNGDEADKTSSFGIEPSNVTEYGCIAGGIDGSYICREDNQALAPQAAAAEFAAMDSTEPEDAPDRFYIELDVNVPEFVRYLSFDYTFNNVGDGDYVYLFAEGESIWLMSGNNAQQGEMQSSGQIPLRMTAGANKLVVALYGVGEKNAEFEIKNLKFTTVFDTDGDGCADDEDDFPEDPKRCIENKIFPWIMFYPAFVAGSDTSAPETFPCADRGLPGPEVVNWQGRDWQHCDDGIYHTREDAEAYCRNLKLGGYSDWHLPSKSELKTLVVCSDGKPTPLQDWDSAKTIEQNYIDATCCVSSTECDNYTKPTIDSSFSSSTSWYWTTDSYLDGRYWIVGFNWGDAYWSYSTNSVNKVRCVR